MVSESGGVEQAVSRAVRDNLDKLQRTANELHQAVADLVAACSSSRPTNTLPPMLRAQTAAASLAASLEVLSRFITSALQPGQRSAVEEQVLRVVSLSAPEPAPAPTMPPPSTLIPMAESAQAVGEVAEAVAEVASAEASEAADMIAEGSPPEAITMPAEVVEPFAEAPAVRVMDAFVEAAAPELVVEQPIEAAEPARAFDLAALAPDAQELHRRANRIAKVSMQDIKMLRPEQVRLGRVHKDLCLRLRDDIEKAHKEYDRRFRTILDHPVDYFYYWMVEILASGDPEALGEYPYPSPVLRR